MHLLRIGILLVAVSGLSHSQAPPPGRPPFEVVSVKPHALPSGQFFISIYTSSGPPPVHATGNRLNEPMATLEGLIMEAYSVDAYRILGLPDWARASGAATEHFDIEAKAEGDAAPPEDQLRLMLESLLADRFQLRAHREMREVPVYALVVGKDAPKLHEISEEDYQNQPRYSTRPTVRQSVVKSKIPLLMNLLSSYFDRPLVDRTGLTGAAYEFADLNWEELLQERRNDPMAAQASVFAEIQDKLGLKLEPRKDAVEVVVIEHAERPSAN